MLNRNNEILITTPKIMKVFKFLVLKNWNCQSNYPNNINYTILQLIIQFLFLLTMLIIFGIEILKVYFLIFKPFKNRSCVLFVDREKMIWFVVHFAPTF